MQSSNKKRIIWFFIAMIILIILHFSKIISPVENFVVNITKPISSFIYSGSRGIDNYFYSVFHYSDIKSENQFLKDEISKNLINLSYIKQLEQENINLKEQLNYRSGSKSSLITARVISGFYMSSDSVIRVDKGSDDGIELKMPVIYGKGVIVGIVAKVERDSSEIVLLSDKNSAITVFIEGEEKISGIVNGDLDYSLQMDYIPIDSSVKQGDIIVTSSSNEKVPSGLVVGQIKELIFKEGDFFKRAIIYSPVDYSMLDFVSIIKN